MIKILVIEDDEACAYTIQGGLELLGNYEVMLAHNGKEGLDIFNRFSPDVLVTDIEMPEMDGYELVKQIREKNESVIIIMESGRKMPKDVVKGFSLGVDSYIKKPFVAEELHAHIQAVFKRAGRSKGGGADNSDSYLYIGNYKFDCGGNTLELSTQKQKLTEREAGILKMLYEHKNTVVPRNEILAAFWGEGPDYFHSRSLDVFLSKLRKYLSQDSSIKIITVKNEGLILKA